MTLVDDDSGVADRRATSRDTARKLVAERTEMLVLFCRVAGLEPYHDNGPAFDLLSNFCDMLVDYVAAGHFALYERILDGRERRRELLVLAEELYPAIADTSDRALEFNDKYGDRNACSIDSLQADLSRIGEDLAARIEYEDRLIGLFY